MLAKDFVTNEILALKKTATITDAQYAFQSFKITDIAIVNETDEYIGLLRDDILKSSPSFSANTLISAIPLLPIQLNVDSHIFEAIEIIGKYKLSLLPVVNNKNVYIGVIPSLRLIHYIADIMGTANKGAILIVTVEKNSYFFSQICQIIENNGAKIISMFTRSVSESLIEVTFKINLEDITSIIQSLNRYNYKTKTINAQTEHLDEFMKSRIDNLLSYLNV